MKHFVRIMMLLGIVTLHAQKAEFSDLTKKIGAEIKAVETSKERFEQAIVEKEPGVVLYTLTEISNKGKTTIKDYEINLGDIDINTLRSISKKDEIQIQLIVSKNQKLIKLLSDKEDISYESAVYLKCSDINNSRALVDLLKAAIPISKEITENRLNLNSYEDRLDWLSANVANVDLIKKSFKQTLVPSNDYIGEVKLEAISTSGTKSSNESFEFNLGNLNEYSVVFKTSGDNCFVEVETKRKLDAIKYFKDFEQKNYRSDLTIACENIEIARDLQKVLKDIIPIAREKFEKAIPKLQGFNECIGWLNNRLGLVTIDDKSYNQSFTEAFTTKFVQKESDSKGSTEYIYIFNFIDINKNSIDFDVKGKEILLEMRTKVGNKYINYRKDNELQNYQEDFTIISNSVNEAVIARNVLRQLVEIVEEAHKPRQFESFSKEFGELQQTIGVVNLGQESCEQVLSEAEAKDQNSLRLKSTEISEKKSTETVLEFNLSDLNKDQIKVETSGKTVFLEMVTNYGEKIIKKYEDGKIEDYQNTIVIYANNIDEARKIKELFALLIKE